MLQVLKTLSIASIASLGLYQVAMADFAGALPEPGALPLAGLAIVVAALVSRRKK